MFERFGRGIEGETFSDLMERSWDLENDFSYGDNAPVEEYMGLIMDLYGAIEELQCELSGSVYSGDGQSVLCLMDKPDIARKLLDENYLANLREMGMEDDRELLECIEKARGLSKKQMLEIIPQVCGLVQKLMVTRGSFECVDELLKEVHDQNERLARQKGGLDGRNLCSCYPGTR